MRKLKPDTSISGLLPAIMALSILELFLKNEEVRIIDRLDSLRLNIFS